MTKTEKRELKRLISLLEKAADIADRLEINLSNGAEIGSMVGGIADELSLRMGSPMDHGKCPYCGLMCGCSFDPNNRNDYCPTHRPKHSVVKK